MNMMIITIETHKFIIRRSQRRMSFSTLTMFIILDRVQCTLLVLGFSTVQKSIDLEGIIANVTHDLTELIGIFLLNVLLWA